VALTKKINITEVDLKKIEHTQLDGAVVGSFFRDPVDALYERYCGGGFVKSAQKLL